MKSKAKMTPLEHARLELELQLKLHVRLNAEIRELKANLAGQIVRVAAMVKERSAASLVKQERNALRKVIVMIGMSVDIEPPPEPGPVVAAFNQDKRTWEAK